MRRLIPLPVADVDPLDVYADLPTAPGRPGVRINMVASVDGATAVGGVSGPLSSPADRTVYRILRSYADVVLVAAGTVRAENYKPARRYEEHLATRRARGQADAPRIAVVSRRLDLDWEAPLLADPDAGTVVVTTVDAPKEQRALAERACHVIATGQGDVDLADALDRLGALGLAHVLCEGGPSLNGALAAADLIDEICVTTTPLLAGGAAKRILAATAAAASAELELRSLLEDDGVLLARYRVRRAPATA